MSLVHVGSVLGEGYLLLAGGTMTGTFTGKAVVLVADTAPAATAVYVVRDNTSDLTLNVPTGYTINLAVNGTDVATVSATFLTLAGGIIVAVNNSIIASNSTGYLRLVGGGSAGAGRGGTITLYGRDATPEGTIEVYTSDAAETADVKRLEFGAKAAQGSSSWTAYEKLLFSNVAGAPALTANQAGIGCVDLSADNASIAFASEHAVAVSAGTASTHKWGVQVNGATYYILLSNV